jgi:hypothetical protein
MDSFPWTASVAGRPLLHLRWIGRLGPLVSVEWADLLLSGSDHSDPSGTSQNWDAPLGGKSLPAMSPHPILKSPKMRRFLACLFVTLLLCAPATAVERKSWTKIRYVGGTLPIKSSPYDYNTTLTVTANPDTLTLVIAPSTAFAPLQTLRIKPSQIVSISYGPGAWRRVSEVSGSQLPSKPTALFGLLEDHGFLGIVYQADDGKRVAVLLDSYFSMRILYVLKALSGKEIEN